jgi:acyl-CoA reductase-like NAD-dependent aldehyde dehydrogenase
LNSWKVSHPATGKLIGTLDETPIHEVPRMYQNARQASQPWAKTSLSERLQWLKKLRLHLVDQLDDIAKVIQDSTGKVPMEALTADILTIVDMLKHFEKHAQKILKAQKTPTPILFFGKKSYIEYKPRGVVLVISPWNFPFQLSLAPVLSALVAGNSVILKSSEVTPLVGKCIEALFKDIGFPNHVLQVAHGGKELGASLVQEKPDMIFFTGSVATGKKIQQEAAQHLIPTILELGGKDPMIVCADTHIERAVHAALWGGLTNSGQVCMSVERIYVQKEIAEKFSSRLVEEAKKLKRGFSEKDDFGSMTFQGQVETVKTHLQDALQKGATLLLGPDVVELDMHLEPIILRDVNHTMKVMKEETFGPILPIQTFSTIEEAIKLANDSEYGLNASVWSSDLTKAKEITAQLISGNVVINDVLVSVGNHFLPFGGVKHSGIGRYHGDVGLQAFCHQTSVMMDSGKREKEVNWYPYQGKYEIFNSLVQHFYGKRRNWLGFVRDYLRLLRR